MRSGQRSMAEKTRDFQPAVRVNSSPKASACNAVAKWITLVLGVPACINVP